MSYSRFDVMRSLEDDVSQALPRLLRSPDDNWQPSEFMPDFTTEGAVEVLAELQQEAKGLTDDAFTVLVGNTITEEALPTYASWIFTQQGMGSVGADRNPWSAWSRAWCAEENRHGDVLAQYLYLSGRVDMREVEITIQHLISDGMDVGAADDPYKFFVYTSFQEVATLISHRNIASMAEAAGAPKLAQLCKRVAGDEGRHAKAYQFFFQKFLERDPDEALLAFLYMMKNQIKMPAMNLRESGEAAGQKFAEFEVVAQRSGVYTTADYLSILKQLLEVWDIEHLTGLSPEAAKGQDYLCKLPQRYERMAARRGTTLDQTAYPFKWLAA